MLLNPNPSSSFPRISLSLCLGLSVAVQCTGGVARHTGGSAGGAQAVEQRRMQASLPTPSSSGYPSGMTVTVEHGHGREVLPDRLGGRRSGASTWVSGREWIRSARA